jgi:hypothetical protein
MAKGQQQGATQTADSLRKEAPADLAAPTATAAAQQQTNIGRSADTYDTASAGYKNFAETGGFSPSDETTFLNRATRGVSGTYNVLADAAKRRMAASGGLGTGGELPTLARHSAQDVASANTDAMASLKQQENANKMQGLAGTTNLFDTTTNQVTAQGKQVLDALGLKYNTEEEAGRLLAELSKNKGAFDSTLAGISTLTGGWKNIQPTGGG